MTRCLFCFADTLLHDHHVTGRECPDGPYLDTALQVGICQPCHTTLHVLLRTVCLEWPGGSFLAHRVRRFGMTFRHTADLGRGLVLSQSATEGAAALLFDVAAALEVGE